MKKKQIQLTYNYVKLLYDLAERMLREKSLQPAFRNTLLQLKKDAKGGLSFWRNFKKLAQNKNNFPERNKLQIGGGKQYIHGFINLDIFPPADIIWDCRYGLPFLENKFKFIFSEHFLEHIDFPKSVKKVLSEIYRVLAPNGKLLLGVPDAGKAIRSYCKNGKFLKKLQDCCYSNRQIPIEIYGNIDIINYLFRDQLDNQKYTIHYWAYDEISLINILKSIGFSKIERSKFNPRYCNPKRKIYTLYIKAIK